MTFISHLSFMFVLSIKKIFIFISEFGETCNVLYYYLLFAVGPFRRRVMDLIPNTTGYSPRYVWLRVHFESKLKIHIQTRIQLRAKQTAPLVSKHYENEVTLR